MRSRRLIAAVAGAALAVPAVAVAQEEDFLKVTGGGQVISMEQSSGPGDTIAFNAQQTEAQGMESESAQAKGQLQVINRQPGRGGDQVKFHGTVTCIRTFTDEDDGEMYVRFGGFGRTSDGDGIPFTVDAQDNGEGATVMGDDEDMIAFRRRGANEEDPCDDSDTATELRDTRLARGNVQVHE